MSSAGTETGTATVLSPAIGGRGWQHVSEMVVEYAASSTVTLNCLVADADNGSYGPAVITLPSTSGAMTKYFFRTGANKWKLLWFQFVSTALFQLNFEGCVAYTKSWGSTGAYAPTRIFGSDGGEG
jgi:hypothetical protein